MTTQSTTTKTSAFVLFVGLLFAAGCGGGAEGADQAAADDTSSLAAAPAADAAADDTSSVAAAPAADAAADQAGSDEGERVYGRVCVTCHQADGAGIAPAFPPLAGSAVATGDAEVPIKIVLSGLTGEMTRDGTIFNGMMTPWASALSDAEIAAVLTYVRSNFGNSADAVTEAQVAGVRAATSSQTAPYTTDDLGIAGE
ncbi:MAG: cytochrome c [Gemmatimonadetes bacterium]|nr:MAG: cytochrome c [Gemmatimonadota bacterium]